MSTAKIIEYLFSYAWTAFVIQMLAYKTNTPKTWLAWIPIVQINLFVKIAKKSMKWFWWIVAPFVLVIGSLLLYIPFASIAPIRWVLAILFGAGAIGMIAAGVLILIVWAEIIKILGKPVWTIVLFFIPLVNFVYISYLAFAPSVKVATMPNIPPSPI